MMNDETMDLALWLVGAGSWGAVRGLGVWRFVKLSWVFWEWSRSRSKAQIQKPSFTSQETLLKEKLI